MTHLDRKPLSHRHRLGFGSTADEIDGICRGTREYQEEYKENSRIGPERIHIIEAPTRKNDGRVAQDGYDSHSGRNDGEVHENVEKLFDGPESLVEGCEPFVR